jgi:hypothetical protein
VTVLVISLAAGGLVARLGWAWWNLMERISPPDDE